MNHQESVGKRLWVIFSTFFKVSATCVGGGYAALPMMQETFVEEKKWLTHEEMVDIVAIVQSLPGIIFVNMGIMIGYKLSGFWGAFFAAIGVAIAPTAVIILIVQFIEHGSDYPVVEQLFMGVRSCVCALICIAVYKLGKNVLKSMFEFIMILAGFLALVVFNVDAITLIVISAIIGLIFSQFFMRKESQEILGDKSE